MSEERIKELETLFDGVETSHTLKEEPRGSPAGDKALPLLDKAFTVIEEYLTLKLGNSFGKAIVLTQVRYLYLLLRSTVEHALT